MIVVWLALAALLAPWSTLIPFNAADPISALTTSPQVVFNIAVWLSIATLIGLQDWRLGVVVGYVVLNAMRAPHMARPWTSAAFVVLGAFAFTLLRERPPRWITPLLVWSGIGQIVLACVQIYWFDPLWGQSRENFAMGNVVLGTIGQQTMFGAYVAIVGAIAPWWAVPIFVVGVKLSDSRLAMLALGLALVLRLWRESRRWAIAMAVVVLTVVVLNHRTVLETGKSLDSYHGRLVAWRVGLEVWWEHFRVFGAGTGGWAWFIPQWADRFKELGSHEAWLNAHSLPIQLLLEHGLVGLALAGWLIWGHRRALRRSPVAWCVGVLCLASFPLHVTQVALVAIVGVALTWRRPCPE